MFYRTFAVLALVLLIFIAATEHQVQTPEWLAFQHEFQSLLAGKGVHKEAINEAGDFSSGVRQVLAKDLSLIDRCQTCHLGAEIPSLTDTRQPFTAHPDIPDHPFERFGCVPCHQGQPWGTTKEGAHGWVAFWHKPLLNRSYLEAACGRCHFETAVAGAPLLTRGRELMRTLNCEECHKIRGLGGSTAPDLSQIGSKHPISYLRESVVNPKANDSNSVMPDFELPKEDVQALVVALLALSDDKYPAELYPNPSGEEMIHWAARIPDSLSLGGKLFRSFGCTHCHRAGEVGRANVSDLSGIGLKLDNDALLAYFRSTAFTQTHAELSLIEIRHGQMIALADFLSAFKEQVEVAVVPANATARIERGGQTRLANADASNTSPNTAEAPVPISSGTQVRAAVNVNPASVERGKEIYKAKNCKLCHKLGGVGGSTGPKLDFVGSQREREWLFHHFKDPRAISPGTRMPDFKFSDDDANALTDYMQTLR